ncbi:Thermolysin metallopeptidase, catalytic domain [Nocardioides scoriae]|uniref:Neutral metalloproteinase n=1 Tax=Nocardioides scoriae TaxID=642780 RepID=A0A1H1X1Z5_9ACTN|nr:protealysin inhibitor emfourin [Nocardioides scoriae]SDT03373.1 Thermolysin metallopeptidase, catalytic domain [Nocardioides scoriae]
MRCHFIPAYLLDQLADTTQDEHVTGVAQRTREIDRTLRGRRVDPPSQPVARAVAATPGADWEIHDAHNGTELPGDLVRTAGQPEVGDVTVDEAAVGLTETLALFADYGRDSYDGAGATVVATVHYEKDYDNAFWDGTQLVFGDGDGKVFGRFTKPIDVLGHELAHAVTQYTANLTYQGQSGALNESMSDVFGACTKQRHLGQDAASADWLVGEGIFVEGINGRALRSMLEPGTAYDDPALGKDPQVGSMADYVETTDDNGGVHLNSGIPNRAFVLAARAVGGESWSGAGRIWYAALTSGLAADSDFATFAAATVAAAGEHADAVREAWTTVGVTPGATDVPGTPAPAPTTTVGVRRSGGFAGLVKEGEVDLDSDDPRAPEVRSLVQRIDFTALAPVPPQPDRFVYSFRYATTQAQLPEQALDDDLRTLARIVLDE